MSAPIDAVAEIRRLYYATSKRTIIADLARAIDLLKQLPTEEARQRAAVFMDGLAQLRSEWGVRDPASGRARRGPRRGGQR
jgi:hypothetical protein